MAVSDCVFNYPGEYKDPRKEIHKLVAKNCLKVQIPNPNSAKVNLITLLNKFQHKNLKN